VDINSSGNALMVSTGTIRIRLTKGSLGKLRHIGWNPPSQNYSKNMKKPVDKPN